MHATQLVAGNCFAQTSSVVCTLYSVPLAMIAYTNFYRPLFVVVGKNVPGENFSKFQSYTRHTRNRPIRLQVPTPKFLWVYELEYW